MNYLKLFIHSIAAGCIGFSASLLGAISAMGVDDPISSKTWIVALVATVAAIGKDIHSSMAEPPKK